MITREFKLKDFDGPLDLLLTLIGKAQIDIRDIFVSEITVSTWRSCGTPRTSTWTRAATSW